MHPCFGTSEPSTTIRYTSPVILDKDGWNTLTWGWALNGTPGGTQPFQMDVQFSRCTTIEATGDAPLCGEVSNALTMESNQTMPGQFIQLTRLGSAGEEATVQVDGDDSRLWNGKPSEFR